MGAESTPRDPGNVPTKSATGPVGPRERLDDQSWRILGRRIDMSATPKNLMFKFVCRGKALVVCIAQPIRLIARHKSAENDSDRDKTMCNFRTTRWDKNLQAAELYSRSSPSLSPERYFSRTASHTFSMCSHHSAGTFGQSFSNKTTVNKTFLSTVL